MDLGYSYINFTPSLGSSPEAIHELAVFRGTRHMGCDGKTGETLLFRADGLKPSYISPLRGDTAGWSAVDRSLEEDSAPICTTTWDADGLRTIQTAFVTELPGTRADGAVPEADAFAVCLARFVFTNASPSPKTASLPFEYSAADSKPALRVK